MNILTDDQHRLRRMEGILTGLLRYGALFASGWLLLGMILSVLEQSMTSIHINSAIPRAFLAIGIVMLIALPVLRVAIMAVIFLLEKDYRFAAISMTVLLIITLGFLLGTMNSHIDFL